MDSESPDALVQLNGLLDEIDAMYEGAVGALEKKLSQANTALKQARGGHIAIAAPGAGDSDQEALLAEIAEYEKRVSELETLVEAAAAKDARIAELEGAANELAERDEIIAHRDATIEELRACQTAYDGVDDKLLAYDKQVTALEGQLRERDEKIGALGTQTQELEAGIAQRDARIKALDEQCASEKEQTEAARAETQQKEELLRARDETVGDLQQQILQRDETITKLEAKSAEQEKEIAALREKLARAVSESGAEKLQKALDEKEAEIATLKQNLQTSEKDLGKLELEVKMLLGEVEGMRDQRNELELLQDKVSKLKKALQEERETMVRLKAQQAAPAKAAPAKAAPPLPENEPELGEKLKTAQQQDTSQTARIRAAAVRAKGKRGGRKQMGEILLEAGVLTEQQLAEVIEFQAMDPKRKLGSVVVERGYATEEVIAAALAAQIHVRFIDNLEEELQPGVIKLVPNHLINNHRCVPLCLDAGQLLLAMANPLDLIGIENIELATNLRVDVCAATPSEIDKVIEKYFNRIKARQ